MGEELNFEKFRNTSIVEVCIDDAVKAEKYCVMEPKESIKSIRAALEFAVKSIYFIKKIRHKETDNLDKLIKNKEFQRYINNTEIIESLFYIKKDGNQATHGSSELPAPLAIICLEMLYDFLRWIVVKSNSMKKCPEFAYSVIPNLEYNREAVISEAVDEGDEYYERMKNSGNEKGRKENENSAALYYNLAYKLGNEDIKVLKKAAENSFTGISYIRDSDKTEVHLIGKNYKTVIDCAKKLIQNKDKLSSEDYYYCYYLISYCYHEGGYGADKDDYEAYDYIQECLSYDKIDLSDENVEKIIEIKSQIPEKIIDEKTEKERLKKQIDEFENRFIKLEERMSAAEEDQQNKNQIEELKKEIEKLKEINNANKIEFKNEISDMKKIITDLQNKITAQTVLTKSLQNQIKKADENHKNLKNSYNELVKAVSDMKKNNKAPFEEVGKETEETINNRKQDSYTPSPEEDFNFDRKTGEIIKYTGRNSQVCIPGTISGIAVKRIGKNAFSENTNLTSVIIPDGIIEIGNAVFEGCKGLKDVTIPGSVTDIGSYAFNDCTGITEIRIPDSVTSISPSAFKGCKGLKNVIIPDSVTSIGPFAFEGCKGLKNVIIPDGVTDIGSNAFNDCTGITKIRIPDSVKILGDRAFCNCSNLKTAYVPFELLNNTKDNELIKKVFPQNTKIIKI